MKYQFSSEDGQMIIGTRDDGTAILIELGQDGWNAAIAANPSAFIAASEDPVARLAIDRAAMSATRLQFMAALYRAGFLADAERIAGADFMTGLIWRESAGFQRLSPIVELIGDGLKLSPDALDALFVAVEIE